jgi:hypothetical protein
MGCRASGEGFEGTVMTLPPEGERESSVADGGKRAGDFGDQVLERAYEHALRMLDRDAEILDQMRTRSSFLIAALAIGGTVLSAILSSASRPAPPWWVLVWIGLALACCIAALWSTRDHGDVTAEWAPGRQAVRSLRGRWAEWFYARKENQRLWKIGLNRDDLNRAEASAQRDKNKFEQTLIETMRRAHSRNDRTLTRRADLLRAASVLVLIFFIVFSSWL